MSDSREGAGEQTRSRTAADSTAVVDCNRCQHYYVTWDPELPRGCRVFRIKCRTQPSVIVLRDSGEPCGGFEAKPDRGSTRG